MKSGTEFLKDYYLKHGGLSEHDLDDLVTKSSMSYEQVRDWFSRTQEGVEPQGVRGQGDSEGDMEVKEQREEDTEEQGEEGGGASSQSQEQQT